MKLRMLIVVFILVTSSSLDILSKKWCGYHKMTGKIEKVNHYPNEKHSDAVKRLANSQFEPIRIHIDYTKLDSQVTIPLEKRNALKEVADESMFMFSRLLNVKRLTVPLKLISLSCGGIYSTLSKEGANYDYIMVISFEPSYETTNTEAAASHCQVDNTTERPTAGYIGVSPKLFEFTKKNWKEYFTYLLFHEATHAFVFNDSLFETFIGANGAVIPIAQTLKEETIKGTLRKKIISPKVIEAGKKHFGCDSFSGLELENQGGDGTAWAHWESRVMLTDYMIGESFDEISISELTLALFEDSGWYQTNPFTGGLFKYGRHKGCGFLNDLCITNETSKYPEFCTQKFANICSSGRGFRSTCNINPLAISKLADYKPEYNYFPTKYPNHGGYRNADYCPVAIPLSNSASGFFNGSCSVGTNSEFPQEYNFNESISMESACFNGEIVNAEKTSFSVCYKFECDYSASKLSIHVGAKKHDCPKAGGVLTVSIPDSNNENANINIDCPDFNVQCSSTVLCTTALDCVHKQGLRREEVKDYTPVNKVYRFAKVTSSSGNTSTETQPAKKSNFMKQDVVEKAVANKEISKMLRFKSLK